MRGPRSCAESGVFGCLVGDGPRLIYTLVMIKASDLRKAMHQEPFQPFQICMADAQTFGVPHPEFMAVGPRDRTCIVWDSDGCVDILSVALVTRLEFEPPSQDSPAESTAA